MVNMSKEIHHEVSVYLNDVHVGENATCVVTMGKRNQSCVGTQVKTTVIVTRANPSTDLLLDPTILRLKEEGGDLRITLRSGKYLEVGGWFKSETLPKVAEAGTPFGFSFDGGSTGWADDGDHW